MVINRFCEVLYLSFAKRPLALLSFFFRMSICADHVSCSSNIRPRHFVCVLDIIFYPLIRKLVFFVIFFLFGKKITISVLSTFREILFTGSQCTISSKSWCTNLFICFREMLEYRWLVSSEKWCIIEMLNYFFKVIDIYKE